MYIDRFWIGFVVGALAMLVLIVGLSMTAKKHKEDHDNG